MKKFAFLPIVALVFASACDARQDQRQQIIEPSIPSFSADLAGESGSVDTGESTVCTAYKADLDAAKAANDAEKVATFTAIIEDACTI
jgi:hypothetical protein